MKGGFDYLYSNLDGGRVERSSGHYRLNFNSGAPFQIDTWNNPIQTENRDNYLGRVCAGCLGAGRRITLNLGLRFEHDRRTRRRSAAKPATSPLPAAIQDRFSGVELAGP